MMINSIVTNEIQLVRIHKVAQIFGVSRSTIWLWLRQNKFPRPFKVNGTTVWKIDDLNRFIKMQAGEILLYDQNS